MDFKLGRGLVFADYCDIARIVKAMKENEYKFSTLISETVKSHFFRYYSDDLITKLPTNASLQR